MMRFFHKSIGFKGIIIASGFKVEKKHYFFKKKIKKYFTYQKIYIFASN